MADKKLKLNVVASSLYGSGDAKLCSENMGALDVKDGDEIEIAHGKYALLLNVFEDTIYDPGTIRLRSEDLFLLGAREGDEVEIALPGVLGPTPDEPKKKAKKKKKRRKKRK